MKLKSHKNPPHKKWPQILAVAEPSESPDSQLPGILQAVAKDGDPALRRIVKETRGRAPRSWNVDKRTIAKIQKTLDEETRTRLKALKTAIAEVHRDQLPDPVFVRTASGMECHRQAVPIRAIGICLGTDTATNAVNLMMLAVPSRLAGCESISVCVPPDVDGKIPADVMFAASLCGVDNVYALGGNEAIAAMTCGTATVARADKLFVLSGQSSTPIPANLSPRVQTLELTSAPGRIMILADDTMAPIIVATALVDCAASCPMADIMLVCSSVHFALRVERALDKAMIKVPGADGGKAALDRARIVIFEGEEFRLSALDMANMYAPGQLLIMVQEPAELAEGVYAARTVQCGADITMSERMGCGINMLADANAHADVAGTVGVDDFMHYVDFIKQNQ